MNSRTLIGAAAFLSVIATAAAIYFWRPQPVLRERVPEVSVPSRFIEPSLPRPFFFVDGDLLKSPSGESVVLRGCNAGIAFPNDNALRNLAEVAKTGANCVRLTFRWHINRSNPHDLDVALEECRKLGLIAMPSIWDTTGNWELLDHYIEFWTNPQMVAILRKHERYTLLNLVNEAGDRRVSKGSYKHKYGSVIRKVRAAGLNMPLVIDAAHYGRDESYILDTGEFLLQQDPFRNLLFGWHPYDPYIVKTQETSKKDIESGLQKHRNRISSTLHKAKEKNLCLIVAEFAQNDLEDESRPIDYEFIMQSCEEQRIGWLFWWWYSGNRTAGPNSHAMTKDGRFGNWSGVGEKVSVTSRYSIKNTSKRPVDSYEVQFDLPTVDSAGGTLRPPSNVRVAPQLGAKVNVSWDDPNSDEWNYLIEFKESGASTWKLAKVLEADTTQAILGANNSYFTGWTESEASVDLEYSTVYDIRIGASMASHEIVYCEPVCVNTGPQPNSNGTGSGLIGKYYFRPDSHSQSFSDYSAPHMTREDSVVDFNWGKYGPFEDRDFGVEHFQIAWDGELLAEYDGDYSIFTDARDFVRVFIDGRLVIDHWFANASGMMQGRIRLVGGQKSPIRVEYRAWTGDAWIRLYWSSDAISREIIPRRNLFQGVN